MNTSLFALVFYLFSAKHPASQPHEKVLAAQSFSLQDRYPVTSVNEVFKENILLTLAYLQGDTISKPIDWNKLDDTPVHYTVTLHKNGVFAFHDQVLPEFKNNLVATTHAHFSGQEGFASDSYLVGDGVCHLASLIDYAAQEAGLQVVAPSNHDFARIPDVPRQYGVGIYYTPTSPAVSEQHNLYVVNNKDQDVNLVFDYAKNTLRVSVVEL